MLLDEVSRDYFASLWYFKHNNQYLGGEGEGMLVENDL